MKTAVIYARYSSDNQTEQSIEGQLRVCQDYAERNNITIIKTYVDRAMTGTNDNRPDFQQMIKDSENHNWQYILVYKIDRFSRNKYETAKYKKILKDNGVKLLSAMENIPDTPEGIILESLLEGMAEYYSVELAQKVKRGMNESRLKGNYTGGRLPYGYALNGKKIIIDEERAEIIRYIYKQYSTCVPVSEIIRTLAANGVLYKGKPFKLNTIYKILKNERYTGIYRLEDKIYDKLFPRIIDDDLFHKVQIKNKENHYGKYSIKTTYLFKNKLKCGYCGMPISAESGRTRKKAKLNYYKCLGIKKYHNGCRKETIRQEVLEEFLLDTIISELEKPKTLDSIVQNLLEIQNSTHNINTELNMLLKSKKQAETTLENIMRAIEQGIINKTTNKRMKELEEQIEEIERKIIIEKSKTTIKITEEEIRKFYKKALLQEPLKLIDYLIKEIKLYNDKIEITFNTPSKSPNNQGSSFLSITKYMEKIVQHNPYPIIIEMKIYFCL